MTPLSQRNAFHLSLATRGIMACLSEDVERKMIELSAYQFQFEELFMAWVNTITKNVISRRRNVWIEQGWIASTDLLSDKKCCITINDNQ